MNPIVTLPKEVPVIVCLRTVELPATQRHRFLSWITENKRCARLMASARNASSNRQTDRATAWFSRSAEPRHLRSVDHNPRTGLSHRLRRTPIRRLPADRPLRHRRRLPALLIAAGRHLEEVKT